MTIALANAGASVKWTTGNSANTDFTGGTTPCIVVHQNWFSGFGFGECTITDDLGNVYVTTLTSRSASGNPLCRQYYKANASVSSTQQMQTSGFTGLGFYAACFSGVKSSSPVDQESGAGTTTSGNNIQPGALDPSEDNCLLVASIGCSASADIAIDSSFNILQRNQITGGVVYAGEMAYLVQTTHGSVNPQFSWASDISNAQACVMTVFKSQPSSGGGPIIRGGQLVHGSLIGGGRLAA